MATVAYSNLLYQRITRTLPHRKPGTWESNAVLFSSPSLDPQSMVCIVAEKSVQYVESGRCVVSETAAGCRRACMTLHTTAKTVRSVTGFGDGEILRGPQAENWRVPLEPIYVPTAGAQAFPMDGIGRLGHDPPRGPSADWWVLTTADAAGTNGLTCLPKHGGVRDSKFFGHPSNDRPLRKLLNFNDRSRTRLPLAPSSSSLHRKLLPLRQT
ncbi:unnamed protein product [Chilo suppressalis]|uniref:Uncharacterized protein n=1 Tax=Chilo suppressalis TaxID=168631 RepID=A0ABN8B0P0_CHISP|nr:unnamed protein product [Chilo suppressalis]